jgi:hypothetical protein
MGNVSPAASRVKLRFIKKNAEKPTALQFCGAF